jgi:hypothetical protein
MNTRPGDQDVVIDPYNLPHSDSEGGSSRGSGSGSDPDDVDRTDSGTGEDVADDDEPLEANSGDEGAPGAGLALSAGRGARSVAAKSFAAQSFAARSTAGAKSVATAKGLASAKSLAAKSVAARSVGGRSVRLSDGVGGPAAHASPGARSRLGGVKSLTAGGAARSLWASGTPVCASFAHAGARLVASN